MPGNYHSFVEESARVAVIGMEKVDATDLGWFAYNGMAKTVVRGWKRLAAND